MKLHTTKLAIASVLAAATMAPIQAAELSYDYVNAGVNIGKSTFDVAGRDFDFATRGVQIDGSLRLSDYTYVTAGLGHGRADDTKRSGDLRLKLDDKQTDASFTLGVILPVADNFHVIAEAGALHTRIKTSAAILPLATQKNSDSDTEALFKVGFRSTWFDSFEVEGSYSKAGDLSAFSVGGPMYVTENLGIDLNYTRLKDERAGRNSKNNVIGLGVRYYF